VPTKKQRRRQQKNRRHEWEYVYVDEEGHEVDVDPGELRTTKKDGKDKERPRATGTPPRRTDARGRPARQIEPPSWRRVFKRALIFAPIFVVALVLLNRNQSVATSVAPAVFLLVFFIPFSYFTDWLAYRTYQKRIARTETTAKPKTR
jgi:hypothetical protein